MPEWFRGAFPNGSEIPLDRLGLRLGTALLLGCAVAGIYHLTRRRHAAAAPPETHSRLLTVRVGVGRDPDELLKKAFHAHLEHWALTAAGTARQGVAIDLTFAVRLRSEESAVPLVVELNGLEGVQSVEL